MKKENTEEKAAVKKEKGAIRENIEAILIAVVIALFIRTFIVQAFKIPSGSMIDTLLIGDHILVNKFIYGVKIPFLDKTLIPFKSPERGDVVVFKFPEDPKKDFIKRVIGTGGDTVEVRYKKVFVNGRLLNDDHAYYPEPLTIPGLLPGDNFGPITVPENSLFVMGDNRDHSYDSRFWGFVDLSVVKGKAFIIYWSWNKEEFGVRWNRIGNLIE